MVESAHAYEIAETRLHVQGDSDSGPQGVTMRLFMTYLYLPVTLNLMEA